MIGFIDFNQASNFTGHSAVRSKSYPGTLYYWPFVLGNHQWHLLIPSRVPLQWRHNGRDSVSNHQPHDCLPNRLFRRRLKKTSKLRVTGLCVGNTPVTGKFPTQMANNAENVSIWWRHHTGRLSVAWRPHRSFFMVFENASLQGFCVGFFFIFFSQLSLSKNNPRLTQFYTHFKQHFWTLSQYSTHSKS